MKGQTLGAFIKLVIFAVVTILATFVLLVTISNRSFGKTQIYKADFADATSLLAGNDVRLAGVRVGTVQGVKVVDATDGSHDKLAQVSFKVNSDVPVTDSTVIALRYQNLVGQRYLALVEPAGYGTKQDQNQVIPASRTRPALDLTALFNGFKPLFQALSPKDVNNFAMEVVKTLQGEGGTVADLAAHTASLTNTIADRDAVIGSVVNNMVKVLGTVEARDAGLAKTIDATQRLVSGLARDRNTIGDSLQNIDDLASNSSLLISQIRPYLPSDLTSLRKIANSLNTTKDCPGYFVRDNERNKKNPAAIPRFANNNCKGPNTLASFLKREPNKLQTVIRTATYGGYFNFYLCNLQLGGSVGQAIGSTAILSNAAACKR